MVSVGNVPEVREVLETEILEELREQLMVLVVDNGDSLKETCSWPR